VESLILVTDNGDVQATVNQIKAHQDVISSVMLYCGHAVDSSGRFLADVSNLCDDKKGGGLIETIKSLGVGVEFVVADQASDPNAYHIFWSDQSNIQKMTQIAQQYKILGWNLDLEPEHVQAKPNDAKLYAAFCASLKSSLNKVGTRLTVDVAAWSPMLVNFPLLSSSVDRLMDMDTYVANSMNGWLNGDDWGGFYNLFINTSVPLGKCSVGLGGWIDNCKNGQICWSSTAASGPPRIQRLIADNVTEISFWRLYGKTGQEWPESWWWPLITQFVNS